MKRLALVLAVGTALLTGCAARGPVRLSFSVDAATLPVWDICTNTETKTIVCIKCHQGDVYPEWARDKNGQECLRWTCNHCHAQYCTLVAEPSLKTVP